MNKCAYNLKQTQLSPSRLGEEHDHVGAGRVHALAAVGESEVTSPCRQLRSVFQSYSL